MELGHWVTGSMGHFGHLSRPGHRVIILTRCVTRVFPVFEKMPRMQNVHLKCWNDKSHCQVSVVGLKSLDVSRCNELLLLLMIIKNSLAREYFFVTSMIRTPLHMSRHLEFIIEHGHPVNWVSGSLDSRVTGSLDHKMWPSSMSETHAPRPTSHARRRTVMTPCCPTSYCIGLSAAIGVQA